MLKKTILFALVLMLVLSVTACTNTDNGYEVNSNWDEYTPRPIVPLNEDIERRILEATVEYRREIGRDPVRSIRAVYFNTYDNGVMFVDASFGGPVSRVEYVGGYSFLLSDGSQLLLFYNFEDSIVLSLADAYETDLISREELRDMAWHFYSGYMFGEVFGNVEDLE